MNLIKYLQQFTAQEIVERLSPRPYLKVMETIWHCNFLLPETYFPE